MTHLKKRHGIHVTHLKKARDSRDPPKEEDTGLTGPKEVLTQLTSTRLVCWDHSQRHACCPHHCEGSSASLLTGLPDHIRLGAEHLMTESIIIRKKQPLLGFGIIYDPVCKVSHVSFEMQQNHS